MKNSIEKLKTINLTLPLLGIVGAMAIVIVILANYYGYIKVAGLQNWTKKSEVVEEQKPETKTEEPKVEEPKTETPASPVVAAPQANIALSGTAYATGVKLTWTATNVDTSKGFKILKSTAANPVYPGNYYAYIYQSTATSYIWEIKDGGTYHFRVCQYTGGTCGVYSNNITVKAPYVATETPKPPTTTVSKAKVYWTVVEATKQIIMGNEYTLASVGNYLAIATQTTWPASGFKLVWSKTSGPTYPTRSGDKYGYFSNPATRYGYIDAFDGPGKYFVRTCEYLGGACGAYSNQIEVTLP